MSVKATRRAATIGALTGIMDCLGWCEETSAKMLKIRAELEVFCNEADHQREQLANECQGMPEELRNQVYDAGVWVDELAKSMLAAIEALTIT